MHRLKVALQTCCNSLNTGSLDMIYVQLIDHEKQVTGEVKRLRTASEKNILQNEV